MITSLEKCIDPALRCFRNVSEFTPLEGPEFAWKITYEKEELPQNSEEQVYFILDSVNQAAFSHWVFESAVWLPYFLTLQTHYPNCLVVFEELKSYKKLYMNYFGIAEEKFCLRKDMNLTNACFFHTYTSLNDTTIPQPYYINMMKYIQSLQEIKVEKDIPLLYLPRGIKENYMGENNRTYGIQNQLKDHVRQLGGTVYETDTTTRLIDQIKIVKRARVIVLDYGSNLWVNGLSAEDSKIVCLNIGWHQHPIFPSFGFVWNEIHKTNVVYQIFAVPSDAKTEDGVAIVQFHLPVVLQTILSLL